MLAQIPGIGLVAGKARAMDTALLAGADADGLAILHIADGVRLRVFERDEGDDHVTLGLVGNILVLRHDLVQKVGRDLVVVVALLEGDAEDILLLDRCTLVVRIDLDDVVLAALLGVQDLERLVRIARGDDTVAHLMLEVLCGALVADIGKCCPVSVRAHAVGAAGADIGAGNRGERTFVVDEVDLLLDIGKRRSHSGACRAHVLEGGSGRHAGCTLELADQLPGIQGIEEVDVARLAGEHGHGQVGAILHEDAGRLLVGVAAILEFQ